MEDKSLITIKKVEIDKSKAPVDNESKQEDLESIYYYDRYSRKIFDVNTDGIKIYNRKAKNLKSNILVSLPKDSLIAIAADKQLKYLICLLSNKPQDKDIYITNIILINTFEKKVFDKINDNFSFMLGMFFIGKINNLIYFDINNNQNELYDFCVVHRDKVVFYGIEKKSNGGEYCKKLSTICMKDNFLIKDFCYDYKHKILCIIKTDLSLSFLILTNRKNYKNTISPKIGYVKVLKEKKTLMGMFRRIGDEQKRGVKEHFDNLDKFTETQFFLETIYNSLYLICLCYEDSKIYIHKLENLNSIGNNICIDYPQHTRFSSLQVIDNLIIVHNYLTKIIIVIDIKSKNPILGTFHVNFPYQNNLHINGELLEEKKVFNKKKLVTVNGGTLYNLIFNGNVYDELTDADIKQRKLKKKKKDKKADKSREMNRYDMLINLLHRSDTNNLILTILFRLILNGDEKPKYIVDFFKEIINLDNQAKEKVEIISDKKLAKKELSDLNIPYEVPKPFNVVLAKKNYIKQIDILINLFDKFYSVLINKDKDKNKDSNKNIIINEKNKTNAITYNNMIKLYYNNLLKNKDIQNTTNIRNAKICHIFKNKEKSNESFLKSYFNKFYFKGIISQLNEEKEESMKKEEFTKMNNFKKLIVSIENHKNKYNFLKLKNCFERWTLMAKILAMKAITDEKKRKKRQKQRTKKKIEKNKSANKYLSNSVSNKIIKIEKHNIITCNKEKEKEKDVFNYLEHSLTTDFSGGEINIDNKTDKILKATEKLNDLFYKATLYYKVLENKNNNTNTNKENSNNINKEKNENIKNAEKKEEDNHINEDEEDSGDSSFGI
jgi:hypothetical protein